MKPLRELILDYIKVISPAERYRMFDAVKDMRNGFLSPESAPRELRKLTHGYKTKTGFVPPVLKETENNGKYYYEFIKEKIDNKEFYISEFNKLKEEKQPEPIKDINKLF